jgi:uroporphyrinogen decarboxylase
MIGRSTLRERASLREPTRQHERCGQARRAKGDALRCACARVAVGGRERARRALSGERTDRPPLWVRGLGERALPLPVDLVAATEDAVAPLPTFGRVREPVDVDALASPRLRVEPTQALRAAHPDRALVASCGAPLTLAVSLLAGLPQAKAFAFAHGAAWERLLSRCADLAASHLRTHAEAGADVLELVDPWAERVAPDEFERLVLPAVRALFASLAGPVRTIYHPLGTPHLLDLLPRCGADAWGIDWRVPLAQVRARHPGAPLVGNLDPTLLLAPEPRLRREARGLREAMPEGALVAALGGDLLPQTPEGAVAALADELTRTAA